MTLDQVLEVIKEHANVQVQLTLTNSKEIMAILKDAYKAHPTDKRGDEDYLYIINLANGATEKINCSDVLKIEKRK